VNLKKLPKMIKDFEKSTGLMYMTGFFLTLLGLVLVSAHNIWNNVPAGIITVLSWIFLVKGALMMVGGNYLMKFAKKLIVKNEVYILAGVILLGLGVYISYAGYFM